MLYISGIHALNLQCNLNTCGDWHTSSLDWQNIKLVESSLSLAKDWGIECDKKVPEHSETFNIANTLRAIFDLMVEDKLGYLKGFYSDFICTSEYNQEFFDKVILLRDSYNWGDICNLMKSEFMLAWDNYLKEYVYLI